MESLLQYLWRQTLLRSAAFVTTAGDSLRVTDGGTPDRALPGCFRESRVEIGEDSRNGTILLLDRVSFWRELTDRDPSLVDSAVLVASPVCDASPLCCDGTPVPVVRLEISPQLEENYRYLQEESRFMPCLGRTGSLSSLVVSDWIGALAVERFRQKADRIAGWLDRYRGSWEDVAYVAFSRTLGFGVNNDAFERLALSLPLHFLQKQAGDPLQVEALLFGQAGLLEFDGCCGDGYRYDLCEEYDFLRRKYGLAPIDAELWKFRQLRPQNMPHQRIALLAKLVVRGFTLFSDICRAAGNGDYKALFDVRLEGYWADHYRFGEPVPKREKLLGAGARHLLLINTVAPLLYAYGARSGSDRYTERAFALWEELKPEQNRIVRSFAAAGIAPRSALESQALLQLYRSYCLPRNCPTCRFGSLALRYRM